MKLDKKPKRMKKKYFDLIMDYVFGKLKWYDELELEYNYNLDF